MTRRRKEEDDDPWLVEDDQGHVYDFREYVIDRLSSIKTLLWVVLGFLVVQAILIYVWVSEHLWIPRP